jgi:predicted metallopeptidase
VTQLALDFQLGSRTQLPTPVSRPPRRRRDGPRPFSYTQAMEEVVRDVTSSLDELSYIDLDRVLLSISQARQNSKHGVYASCVPLRFEGGATEAVFARRRYRMQPLHHEEREILYVVYFMLPRFHREQDYHAKLATIIHELYHISPLMNGDIRRFPGKNFAHGDSREVYHAAMCKLADRYLATSPRAPHWEFLKAPFEELLNGPGGLVGLSVPKPRATLVHASGGKSR